MKNVKKALYLAFFSLTIPGSLLAQSQLVEKIEAAPKSNNISYEKWKLPNGLTIILHEDHSDPIVHVEVAYHVGSARESLGKSGFAHFFEHMMFQGSNHVKDEEHFKIVSEAGGQINGNTTEDRTVYFETMPSNHLETALWLEADRMGFLLDSVTQKKFEVQRSTVKNEKGQNVENQPYGLAFSELIGQALYPAGHPYSWPTIGYTDDLNRVTVKDLKDFFLRWYGPNNAILSISGDINSAEALKLSEKYFATIPRGPEVKKMRIEPPILAVDQYASYTDNVYFPLALMTFPTVARFNRDEPALDILASIMGEGNNSIFYRNFVKNDKAIQAQVGHTSKELSGEFQIAVFAYAENPFDFSFNDVEKNMRETIDQFEKEGITDEQLERQKSKYESRLLDNAESVAGKAEIIADYEMYIGKPFNLSDDIERYKKVTKEDVVRVFNKYIKGKHAAIVNVYPANPMAEKKDSVKSRNPYANYKAAPEAQYQGLKYVKATDNFDRAKKPVSGTAKAPVVPQYYSSNLPNGLKIIGTKNSEIPKVYLMLEMDGGDLVVDKAEKTGLSQLTAAMMNEGTTKYTTEQISAELEKLGSTISFTGNKQSTQVHIECLTRNLDATLKLLEEKLFSPRFDQNDFYRVRKALVESIKNNKTNSNAMAQDAFGKLVYGENLLGAYATEKSMKKLSLEDVKAYYQKNYSPSVANFVVVGDVSKEDILPKLEFFKKWEAKEVKLPTVTNFPKAEKPTIYLVNKYNATQSVINIGQLGMAYDATGDYFKANVMNYPLGGAFNSRINLNLREDKGFTYGARSGFSGSKLPGIYGVSTSVRGTATDSSVTEIMKELTKYVAEGPKDEEVSFTKSSLLSSDALKYETLGQKANFLSRIAKYNLPADFISKQGDILKAMNKSDMSTLAKRFLDPSKVVIVVVGDKTKIKKNLEALGYGKVKEVFVD